MKNMFLTFHFTQKGRKDIDKRRFKNEKHNSNMFRSWRVPLSCTGPVRSGRCSCCNNPPLVFVIGCLTRLRLCFYLQTDQWSVNMQMRHVSGWQWRLHSSGMSFGRSHWPWTGTLSVSSVFICISNSSCRLTCRPSIGTRACQRLQSWSKFKTDLAVVSNGNLTISTGLKEDTPPPPPFKFF